MLKKSGMIYFYAGGTYMNKTVIIQDLVPEAQEKLKEAAQIFEIPLQEAFDPN
jgi:hypothetical protein